MKLTIQIKVSIDAAHKFIGQMESQGYVFFAEDKDGSGYFQLDGVTSIKHSISIYRGDDDEPVCYIGIRPD